MRSKKWLFSCLLASVLCLAITNPIYASNIASAIYRGTIAISNNSTNSINNTSVPFTLNTQSLIDGNFINTSANNTAMQIAIGSDIPYMPGNADNNDPWMIFVNSLSAQSSSNYLLYTGGTADLLGKIRYFPDTDGMVVSDDESLELGNHFVIEIAGLVDTTNGTNKDIAHKGDAFKVFISDTDNLTVEMSGGYCLDFVRDNSDWVEVADHADFSFTDGANDYPFTLIAWGNFDDVINNCILDKSTAAVIEWRLLTNASGQLFCAAYKSDATANIGRRTNAITAFQGKWTHFAATYDGSKTNGGFNIYINGVDSDTANSSSGTYTGMSDTAAKVSIGSIEEGNGGYYLNGAMAEIKIYKNKCFTPAEVLSDYNGTINTTNLKGYWKFDEGTGNPADSSGQGHNGTNHGADWKINTTPWKPTRVSAGDVSSKEHIILITADGNYLKLWIDTEEKGSSALSEIGMANTSDNWTFFKNGVMPYVEYIKIWN